MKSRSDETLRKAARHFMYEVTEFRQSAFILLSRRDLSQSEINTYLDDFVVHARNLYSFFYDEKPQDDDVVVGYYLKNKKEFLAHCTPKDDLSIINKKAGKQVVHLTFSRLKYDIEGKGWTVNVFLRLMEITLIAFFSTLDSDKKDWFS